MFPKAALEQVQSNLVPRLCHRQRCDRSRETLFLYAPEIFWSSRTVERKWILCVRVTVLRSGRPRGHIVPRATLNNTKNIHHLDFFEEGNSAPAPVEETADHDDPSGGSQAASPTVAVSSWKHILLSYGKILYEDYLGKRGYCGEAKATFFLSRMNSLVGGKIADLQPHRNGSFLCPPPLPT
uniref:Uncharacterized protein n=1 Tax=Timema tahoe TaxID=61484 RepID=A0A7R9IR54_9NEOP|nr:unnamed protein product [Timema tahoe]